MALDSTLIRSMPVSGSVGRIAAFWATAGALTGSVGLSYALAMDPFFAARAPMPLPVFVLVQFMEVFVLLALLSWAGLRLGQAIGLGSPIVRYLAYRTPSFSIFGNTLAIAVFVGSMVGVVLLLLDKVFQPYMPATLWSAPLVDDFWTRFLASFSDTILEELVCRLFLMTFLVWVWWRFVSSKDSPPSLWLIWTGIIGASLLFGLGHLPAIAEVWPLTTIVIFRSLLLNAIGGIAFGWLYSHRGFEYAVIAHLFQDIVLHVIGGR